MNQATIRMVTLLQAKNPSAIAYVRRLAHRHHHGDQVATRALQNIADAWGARGIVAMGASPGATLIFGINTILRNAGHVAGRVVGTAGRLVQGAGHLVQRVTQSAAKPFTFVEKKLGGDKPLHLLPPHRHVP